MCTSCMFDSGKLNLTGPAQLSSVEGHRDAHETWQLQRLRPNPLDDVSCVFLLVGSTNSLQCALTATPLDKHGPVLCQADTRP